MKIIPKPQKSEIILLAFFITFLIIISLFFINLNNKCRGINSFAFDQIKKDKLYAVLEVECGEIVIEIIVTGVDEIVLLGAVVVCEIHEDKIVIDLDEVKEMID